jgi:hypothetical protein
MTIQQLYLFSALYLVMTIVAAVLTRATQRRLAGAVAGAAAVGVFVIVVVAIGERARWWHFEIPWEPYFMAVLWVGCVFCAYIFLITWRIARRFGGRGLVILLVVAAILGPVRDYAYMRQFPSWGTYAPGIAPALAISLTYVLGGIIGHGVMRLIAGPSRDDQLARALWERK